MKASGSADHGTGLPAPRRKEPASLPLVADALAGNLSGSMLALARAVTSKPESFSPHHAARLRNACNVALGAAHLIERAQASREQCPLNMSECPIQIARKAHRPGV